jgi:hypothetical protein
MTNRLFAAGCLGLSAVLAACGSGLNDSVDITAHTIAPEPVPAPTAQAASTFVITKTVRAKPDFRQSSLRILGLDPNDPNREYIGIGVGPDTGPGLAPVSFSLGCGADICTSGTTQTQCQVALASAAGGRRRRVSCEGNRIAWEIPAGKYAYALTAQTQTGTFFGGETATVTGTIEFQ